LTHADAQAVGHDGHLDQARRGGQRQQALGGGFLIECGGLGAGAGHELAVNAQHFGLDVAQGGSSTQGHGAIVGGGVGHGGVAHHAFTRFPRAKVAGWRAWEPPAQGIAQVPSNHLALKFNWGAL